MEMKLLITGVKGFLATNMVNYYINNSDYDVLGVVNSTSNKIEERIISNLKKQNKTFNYVLCNLTNNIRLKGILDKESPDMIINCASQSEVIKSFDQPYEFLKSNLECVFNILEWLRYAKTGAKFVQLSTEAVFGQGDDLKHDENSPLQPKNLYSASKAAAEHYVSAYNSCFGLNTKIVRPVNNFGPYQNPNKLIAKTIINCIKNLPFELHKEEKPARRFWLYVDDTIRAIDYVVKYGRDNVYNISPDEGLTTEEAIKKILAVMKSETLLQGYSETRRKDSEHYFLDNARIKELGWSPKYSFEEGIEKTIDWFKENNFWYEQLNW